MQILIKNTQKDLPLSKASIQTLITTLCEELSIFIDEISLHFVSKKKISSLHDEFFQDPSPTDCISCPIDPPKQSSDDPGYSVLGEIFVCPKVAIEYGQKHKIDAYEETSLYVVHGLLHLLGFDDMDTASKKKMRRHEKKCMTVLRKRRALLKP